MNFDLSEDQIMLRDLVRDFAHKEISPRIGAYEDGHRFPKEILARLAELGILGSRPGGVRRNRTDTFYILALEELAGVGSGLRHRRVHDSLFCGSICSGRFPKKNLGGRPGRDSAPFPDGTGCARRDEPEDQAARSGAEYILNGTKAWVTTGGEADALIVMARTGSEAGAPQLSAFIVEKGFPGFIVSKIEEKMGLHSSPTAMVSLEDCRVPAENLLGQEGRGAAIALAGLDGSRIGIAAQAVGLSQQALELAVGYAKQREAFGKKIAEFQALQFMLADIATLLEAGRLLTYRAADLHDRGRAFGKEAAMAKLFTSEAANRIAYLALQIHGGYGYSKEYEIERIYRDARVLSIYEARPKSSGWSSPGCWKSLENREPESGFCLR
jgi:alkylation response protein AidB-like acyl-CoA dehydrogenase